MRTDPETAPSDADLKALNDELFGTPVLNSVETDERDKLDAYAVVYEVAKQFPAVAREAARDGTAAHYRGADPFDYSMGETRERGEVAQ